MAAAKATNLAENSARPVTTRRASVGFVENLVTGVSRPLTHDEHWTLYELENHLCRCKTCFTLFKVQTTHARPCPVGRELAVDVKGLLFKPQSNGHVFQKSQDGTWVRVEVPAGYICVQWFFDVKKAGFLKRPERNSYDRAYAVAPRVPTRPIYRGSLYDVDVLSTYKNTVGPLNLEIPAYKPKHSGLKRSNSESSNQRLLSAVTGKIMTGQSIKDPQDMTEEFRIDKWRRNLVNGNIGTLPPILTYASESRDEDSKQISSPSAVKANIGIVRTALPGITAANSRSIAGQYDE